MKIDKAVVLAAGRATRMRELTAKLPKPMVEVHSQPVIQHILEGLRNAGSGDLLLIVGNLAEAARPFFGDGKRYNLAILHVTQSGHPGYGRGVELAPDL